MRLISSSINASPASTTASETRTSTARTSVARNPATRTSAATISPRRSSAARISAARTRGPGPSAAAALLLSALCAAPCFAQDTGTRGAPEASSSDLTEAPPPPRILEQERAKQPLRAKPDARPSADTPGTNTAAAPSVIGATPFQARLAPAASGRDDDLDEIIVIGRNDGSHLPDLGGSLRAQREAERGQGRIEFMFLPLYEGTSVADESKVSLFGNREMQRVGYINLFRFRFGGRSKE